MHLLRSSFEERLCLGGDGSFAKVLSLKMLFIILLSPGGEFLNIGELFEVWDGVLVVQVVHGSAEVFLEVVWRMGSIERLVVGRILLLLEVFLVNPQQIFVFLTNQNGSGIVFRLPWGTQLPVHRTPTLPSPLTLLLFLALNYQHFCGLVWLNDQYFGGLVHFDLVEPNNGIVNGVGVGVAASGAAPRTDDQSAEGLLVEGGGVELFWLGWTSFLARVVVQFARVYSLRVVIRITHNYNIYYIPPPSLPLTTHHYLPTQP